MRKVLHTSGRVAASTKLRSSSGSTATSRCPSRGLGGRWLTADEYAEELAIFNAPPEEESEDESEAGEQVHPTRTEGGNDVHNMYREVTVEVKTRISHLNTVGGRRLPPPSIGPRNGRGQAPHPTILQRYIIRALSEKYLKAPRLQSDKSSL